MCLRIGVAVKLAVCAILLFMCCCVINNVAVVCSVNGTDGVAVIPRVRPCILILLRPMCISMYDDV